MGSDVGKNHRKWDDHFYVKAYQFAVCGMNDKQIGRALGLMEKTFYKYVKEKPALREALNEARSKGAGTRQFMRLVSNRVPDDLRDLWEELSDDDDAKRQKAYLTIKQGDKRRAQHLFVHAYIAANFNESKAVDMTGLNIHTVVQWKQKDKHFKALLAFIKESRKEFGQNALMEKISEGDTAAIIFFNRTFNKDLGYDTRIQLDVKGEVEHKNTISVKDLPPEKLRELLEIARQKKVERLEDRSKIQDAEFEVKELSDG